MTVFGVASKEGGVGPRTLAILSSNASDILVMKSMIKLRAPIKIFSFMFDLLFEALYRTSAGR